MSSGDAARIGRAVRDEAGRYQSLDPVTRAVDRRLLRPHPKPSLYRYRINLPSGPLLEGLVGVVRLEELIPHEGTVGEAGKPAPEVEIRPLLGITEQPLPSLRSTGPASVVVAGRLTHEIEPVAGGDIDVGRIVLADGHHRRRAALRDRGTDADHMILVVGSSGAGLTAGSFQRRVAGVVEPPRSVRAAFEVTSIEGRGPRAGAIVWVSQRGSWLLRPRPETVAPLPAELRDIPSAVAGLVLLPLMGRDETSVVAFSTAQAATRELGSHEAAVLLPPVPIAAVLRAAAAGVLFPPKGTRFRPKPVRGLVMRATQAENRASTRA